MNALSSNRVLNSLIMIAMLSAIKFNSASSADVPIARLHKETSVLLRQEATAGDVASKDAAIAALCDLFAVIRSTEQYPESELLQGDAAKIRHRLLTIARNREAQLKRDKVARPADMSTTVESAISTAIAEQASVGQLLQPSPAGGNGGGAMVDNGWGLIALIQRTVDPDFWERAGGPGVIRYFAMRRVLVVRATSDVHEQIKDLLTALR